VPFALHTRTSLLPAALASVSFGFVLVRVCVLGLQRVGPPEVIFEFLKSSSFVVAVFLSFNRVIVRLNMPQEATRTPHMVPWGWDLSRKTYFLSLVCYEKYLYLSTFKHITVLH
jgi:hypothetical protein